MPEDKAERVAPNSRTIRKDIGVIAHACGVREPRQLRRYHCRIVQDDGRSRPLEETYPEIDSDFKGVCSIHPGYNAALTG